MALVIYDHGYRIQTPTSSEFPPRGVQELTELRGAHRTADPEDRNRAEDRFIQRIDTGRRKDTPSRPAAKAYVNTEEKAQTLPNRRLLVLSHIMTTPVHVITKGATIFAAWRKMEELRIRHLIVVGDDQQLLGILSGSDILNAGKNSPESIETIYSQQVIAASPDTQVRHVAQSFVEHKINAMPVVDERDKVVGIITRTDLLHLLVSGPNLERWA